MTATQIIESNCKKICRQKSSYEPMFIFLGGLPGSGKTLLIEKVESKYSDRDFVVIDVDFYRKYLDFDYKDRYKAVDESVMLSNYIEEKLLDYAIEHKKDIISVSSLRATELILEIIEKKLLTSNYKINCEVIITNEVDSILSSLERYVDYIKNKDDIPRMVKIDYFKLCAKGLKKTLKSLYNLMCIDEINIYKRGNNFSLPIELYNLKDKKTKNVISEEIKSQLDNLDRNLILRRLSDVENRLNKLKISNLEREEINSIRSYIENQFNA